MSSASCIHDALVELLRHRRRRSADARQRRWRKRRGFVLGAGGVLGAAWTTGALVACEDVMGFDARDCDISSGHRPARCWRRCSATASRSPSCATTSSGERSDQGPLAGVFLDPRPATPAVAAERGRAPASVRRGCCARRCVTRSGDPAGRGVVAAAAGPRSAVDGGGTWSTPITPAGALDPAPERRGSSRWTTTPAAGSCSAAPGAPEAALPDAVLASCSIPAGTRRCQSAATGTSTAAPARPTSLDLLAGLGLDEVYVLAPMISFDYDEPAVGRRPGSSAAFRRR